jgi:HAD superfamily hydrolase (TIGR01509 family)
MINPKALIFDMDGVLSDNFKLHEVAWMDFAKKISAKTEPDEIRKIIFGRRNKEVMDTVFGRHLVTGQIEELSDQKEEVYMRLARGKLKPLDGLLDFLRKVQQKNIPMAVATSSPRKVLDFTLNELGLNDFFQKVKLSAEDVKEGKPSPEIFQLAAIRLSHKCEDCLVFEDSIPGIRAARSAGCLVATPLTTLTESEASREKPDVIFSDFTQEKIKATIK